MNLHMGWNRQAGDIVSWVWDALDPDHVHENEYYRSTPKILSPTMLYWDMVSAYYTDYFVYIIATGPWF